MFSQEEMYDGADIIGGNEVQIIFSEEDDEVLNISLVGHEEENSVDLSGFLGDIIPEAEEGSVFDIRTELRAFVMEVKKIRNPLTHEEYLNALIESLGQQKRERVYPVVEGGSDDLNKIGKTLFNILKIHPKKFKEFLFAGLEEIIVTLFFTFVILHSGTHCSGLGNGSKI